jgi:hypothetical protein
MRGISRARTVTSCTRKYSDGQAAWGNAEKESFLRSRHLRGQLGELSCDPQFLTRSWCSRHVVLHFLAKTRVSTSTLLLAAYTFHAPMTLLPRSRRMLTAQSISPAGDHPRKEEGLIRHYQPPAQFGVRFGVKTRRFLAVLADSSDY